MPAMRERLLEGRTPAAAWLQPLALLLAAGVSNSVYLCFSGIADETAAWIGASPGEVDALTSLGNAAAALGYPLAAYVADRIGIGAGFFAGVAVTAVGCGLRLVGGFAKSFPLLAAGQFIANIGNVFFNVLPAPLAVLRFPPHRQGLANALGQIGVDLGSYAGPSLGGMCRGQPGRLVWIQFLLSAAMLPLVLLFFGNRRSSSETMSNAASPSDVGICKRLLLLLRLPGMAVLCLGSTAGITALSALPAALEQVACAVPGLSVSTLSGALALSVLLGEACAGPAADALSVGSVLCFSALTVCAGWLLCLLGWLLVLPPSAILVGWVMLAMFGTGTMTMLSFLKAAEAVPAFAGTASALLHFTSSAACVLGMLVDAVVLNSVNCEVHVVRELLLVWSGTGWLASALIIVSVMVFQRGSQGCSVESRLLS